MTITARELEQKYAGWKEGASIGASDVYKIVTGDGVTDLWYQLRGLLKPDDSGLPAELGNALESWLLDGLERKLDTKIRRGGARRWKACKCVLVHLDGLVIATKEPAEAKTTGVLWPLEGDWGEDGTDGVPKRTMVQVQTQMAATDADKGHVAALIGGKGKRTYTLYRNDDLIRELEYWVDLFWKHNVQGNVQPTETPCMDTMKRVVRQPKSIVKMPPNAAEWLKRWLSAKDDISASKKEEEYLRAGLLKILGTAEAGEFEDGQVLTYLEQKRAGYTVEPTTFPVAKMTTMEKLRKKWS